ncbi:TPA: hypothetical protein HA270_02570 [Candidatus Woesearchaeota archaeon]|nr:hypothetical protein [Candidatus Woesearchaeota archaeon]
MQYAMRDVKAKKSNQQKKANRKKARYVRDEQAYNEHQDNEFLFFISALPHVVFHALVDAGLNVNTRNFQRYFIAHMCLAIKEYFNMSLRRARGLCRFIFWAMQWRCQIPCFKTLDNYMM